jgi:hypothetical protein
LHPSDRARPCIDEAEQGILRRPWGRQRNCHMNNHILVFYDREGNERFFLRRKGRTADIQRYLLWFALWGEAETPWANVKWELRF